MKPNHGTCQSLNFAVCWGVRETFLPKEHCGYSLSDHGWWNKSYGLWIVMSDI